MKKLFIFIGVLLSIFSVYFSFEKNNSYKSYYSLEPEYDIILENTITMSNLDKIAHQLDVTIQVNSVKNSSYSC